mgnify:CR=1 FL=1
MLRKIHFLQKEILYFPLYAIAVRSRFYACFKCESLLYNFFSFFFYFRFIFQKFFFGNFIFQSHSSQTFHFLVQFSNVLI